MSILLFFASNYYIMKNVFCETRSMLLFNNTNRRTRFQIYSGKKLYMFRVVPLPSTSRIRMEQSSILILHARGRG